MERALRILIIDDMQEIRGVLRHHLHRLLHATILEAENGLAGMEAFVNSPPDLVFCDIIMPVMTGLECLGFMTRQTSKGKCRFIVLTTADDEETQVQAKGLSADAFLRKPFKASLIEDTVRRLVPPEYFIDSTDSR